MTTPEQRKHLLELAAKADTKPSMLFRVRPLEIGAEWERDPETGQAVTGMFAVFHTSEADVDYVLAAANLAPALAAEVERLRGEKDGAYGERDKLVAVLSKLFPASLERHKPENDDWEDDWRWVVFIDIPTGQVSWHIHDSELPLFSHLRRDECRSWDGHSTDEKYRRLEALRGGDA